MRAVDTNVLVRLITRDDPRQAAAAEKFTEQGAWISHLVLAEATWVLDSVYGLTAREISIAVQMLLEHKNLTIQDPGTVEEALGRFRHKPSLGFSDCLILETARKAGHSPLGTFDRNLGRQDGAHPL